MGENERRARDEAMRKAAKDQTDSELDAARKKTARLKAERLAKDAGEGRTELDPKPAGPKKRTTKPHAVKTPRRAKDL